MAEQTKQALKVENNTNFPNNNTGFITPALLREFNTDMIDSTVNQITYTADSSSFNTRINSLDPGSTSGSIASLNEFTASIAGTNAFTASALTTASFSGNTLTFTKGNGSTFGVVIPDVSGSVTTALNQATASLQAFTASVAGTNAFTQSAQLEINSLEAFTSSVAGTNAFTASIRNTNAFTQSAQLEINALEAFTASVAGTNTFTQSAQVSINALNAATSSYARTNVDNRFTTSQTITGSLVVTGDITANKLFVIIESSSVIYSSGSNQFGDELTDTQILSGSTRLVGTATLNGSPLITSAQTASYIQDLGPLNAFSASTNLFTQSAQLEINALEAFTASIRNTNTFTASLAGTNAFTASIAGTNTFTQSAQLEINALEAFTASIAGTNAFTASAQNSLNSLNAATSSYITSAVTASMSVATASFAATASLARNVVVTGTNANQSTLPIGTVVRITGATGDVARFNSASWESDSTSANALGVLRSSVASGATGEIVSIGTVIGIDTDGMSAGDVLYLGPNGTFTNVQPQAPLHIVTLGEVLRVQQNNGSMFVNISNGWELNELHNVRIVNPLQGDLLVYEASSSLWKNAPSSSVTPTDISALNAFTASIAGTNAFTQSANQRLNSIETQSGSWVTSAITGGLVNNIYSSVTPNTIEYTRGNGTTSSFAITVVGTDITALNAFTASVAGTNAFTASTNTWTSSTNARLNSIEATTASLQSQINLISGSGTVVAVDALNSFTASVFGTNAFTASIKQTNAFTQSAQAQLTALADATGSYATTGSNTFEGGQRINGTNFLTLGTALTNETTFFQNALDNKLQITQIGAGVVFNNINVEMSELTASLQEGYIWVGNEFNRTIAVPTSSFAKLDSANTFNGNQIVSGSMTVTGNLNVFGSASFTTVTSSVYIGGNTILLNTFTPSVRYGGMEVIDSGSTGLTGSLLWDSQNDVWLYVNPSGSSYASARLISGPKSLTLGSEPTLTQNRVPKADDGDHIVDSQISDDGTTVTITNAISASTFVGLGNLSLYSASVDTRLNNIPQTDISALNAFTASIAGTNAFTASTTIRLNSIESRTGSFATTGSNRFVGDQTITGSLTLSGSAPIELSVIGNSVFSGSVVGRVLPVTITANTASLDFSQGNFFTVAMAATVGTHISASNVQPGETVSVRITQNATPGTLTYPPSMRFPSGSAYTASTIANAVDVITFISFDNSTVLASSVKNLV